MIKKVFRPLWSFDIPKTEKWLSQMAEKGLHLIRINRHTSVFYFQQGKPETKTYEIVYDKLQGEYLPSALTSDGWEKVTRSKHWYIMVNSKQREQIKTSSDRESVIKRNRTIMYVFGGISLYFVTTILVNIVIITTANRAIDGPVEVTRVDSPYWIITYTLGGLLVLFMLFVFYCMIKINRTNKQLVLEVSISPTSEISEQDMPFSKKEERNYRKKGMLIRKFKPGWFYAPDKLEQWLEYMEEKGFNLYRVGRIGTLFYFVKGKSRKMSYCTEYQNIAKESSSRIHSDAGWNHIYSSKSSLQKWTLWSREYSVGEEKPQIYNEMETHLKHAKRIARAYSLLFLPLVFMQTFLIVNRIIWMIHGDGGYSISDWWNLIFYTIPVVLLGSFAARTWLYYRRLKKRYAY